MNIMVLPTAAIMPHGFCENVTRITGLGGTLQRFSRAGELAALGYNRALSRVARVMTDSRKLRPQANARRVRCAADRPAARRRRSVVRSSSAAARVGTSTLTLGFPLAASGGATRRGAARCTAQPRSPGASLEFTIVSSIVAHCRAARAEAAARSPQHDRRRVGQGRRRQVHGRRQPRARAGGRRRARRHARRRHLRPEPAADAGLIGQAAGVARRQDARAAARPRRPGDVDRLPGRRAAARWCGAARWSRRRWSSC